MRRVLLIATVLALLVAPAAEAASPTLRQFNALKRQVTTLQNRVNTLEDALAAAVSCLETVPISRFGVDGGTEGYLYQLSPSQVIITGALDFAAPTGTIGEDYGLMITINNAACAAAFPSFSRASLATGDETRTRSLASWGW